MSYLGCWAKTGLMLLLVQFVPGPLQAQGRYNPAIQVGDEVITLHQIDQRTLFLSLLGAGSDARELARQQLVNEAVQLRAARDAGIVPDDAEVEQAMAEFASRGDLTLEQFLQALAQGGVTPQTYRDFITAGVAWRNLVRARFNDTARNLPRDQIERSLARSGTEGGLRVLVSEILLPATTPETTAASRERAATLARLEGEDEFAAAARRFSVAPSRTRGGALNWVALDTLPESVRGVIASLSPGQISRPVQLENAIGIFLLREIERVPAGTPESLAVDYALFVVEGERGTATGLASRLDTCDDLYGVAKGLPEERLVRETLPVSALPADVRAEISRLDENETSTALTRGGRPTILMLCGRKPALESSVDFEIVWNRLTNARLGAMAADYLADLRARTPIVELTN